MYKPHQKEKPERDEKILEYHKKGYSLNQIGKMFHISRERVRQIIKKKLPVEKSTA